MATTKEIKARLRDLVGMNVYLRYTGVNHRTKYKGIITATVESMGTEFVKLAGHDKMRVIPDQRITGQFGDSFNLFFSLEEAKDVGEVKKIAQAIMTKFPSTWSYDKMDRVSMEKVAKLLGVEY